MNPLDHQTFHALEIDALYEELDGPSSAAIRDHAASCESCASRFERLRRARQRGLSVLVEAVPDNFESRVMAAVDAALAKRASGGPVLVPRMEMHSGGPPPRQAPPAAGAKVIPFFARPSFQVAATLFLVLGAAALVTQLGMSKRASPMASSADQSPAAVAAAPAPEDLSQAPAEQPVASAMATTTTASPTAAPIVALGGAEEAKSKPKAPQDPDQEGALALRAPSPSPPAAIAAQKPSKAARPSSGASPTGGQGGDPAFAAAQALFNAGRYAEALPRFEALKGSNPEADLYAARCLQQTRGCAAAAPRYDAAAQRNSGTSVGSRAQLEGGACYAQLNKPAEARSRYQAAKRQGTYEAEADADLAALDRKAASPPPAKQPPPNATSGPGNPANKAPASELDNALH